MAISTTGTGRLEPDNSEPLSPMSAANRTLCTSHLCFLSGGAATWSSSSTMNSSDLGSLHFDAQVFGADFVAAFVVVFGALSGAVRGAFHSVGPSDMQLGLHPLLLRSQRTHLCSCTKMHHSADPFTWHNEHWRISVSKRH